MAEDDGSANEEEDEPCDYQDDEDEQCDHKGILLP